MRDGTSKSPSRPRSRRNLAVSGSACTALGRPAVEPYTGSPTMALRRDVAPASPVATRLPRTTRLRFALHGAQRGNFAGSNQADQKRVAFAHRRAVGSD